MTRKVPLLQGAFVPPITPFKNGTVDYELNAKPIECKSARVATAPFDASPIPVKYMMKRMGVVPANEHRLPMASGAPDPEKRLDGVLKRAGLI